MTKWHIKEISDLTNISVRMLRHYDKIGLLEPSYRESNGYRCYSEPDLAKLQQIVALKFFGFSLKEIKEILQGHSDIYAHLQVQQKVVKNQSAHLQQVSQVIASILKCRDQATPPNWQDLLLLIKGYTMTTQLRDKLQESWAGKNLTPSQFEDYLKLYEKFPDEFAKRDAYIEEINQQTVGEPEGPDGERIATFIYELAKKMEGYFAEQIELSASLAQSIQSGELTQLELSPEGTHWLGRAMSAYILKNWDEMYAEIVKNIDVSPESEQGKRLANQWRSLVGMHINANNRDFMLGILLWQECARQDHEIKEQGAVSAPQDMIKPWHIKILFDAKASTWICKALEVHQ